MVGLYCHGRSCSLAPGLYSLMPPKVCYAVLIFAKQTSFLVCCETLHSSPGSSVEAIIVDPLLRNRMSSGAVVMSLSRRDLCLSALRCARVWKLEAHIRCLPWLFSSLFFEAESLIEPGTH